MKIAQLLMVVETERMLLQILLSLTEDDSYDKSDATREIKEALNSLNELKSNLQGGFQYGCR